MQRDQLGMAAVIDKGFGCFMGFADLGQDIIGMAFAEMCANAALTVMNIEHKWKLSYQHHALGGDGCQAGNNL